MGASVGTCEAGLAATWPATATRPAAIRSAAWSRDLARPRRTSSASSRSLLLILAVVSPSAGRRAGVTGTGVQLIQDLTELCMHLLEELRVIADRQSGQPVQ